MGFGIKLIDGISQANNQVFKMLAGKDVDLTEADDFGGNLADADLILVDDAAAGTQASTKKSAMSRVWTYIQAKITGTANIIDSDQYVDGSIDTAHIGDDQVTEAKLANSLLAEIDANTAKSTNVTTDLSATTSTTTVRIDSSDGTNATIPVATTSIGGVMSKAIFDEHTANNAKATNVATNLTASTHASQITINSSDGDNVVIAEASNSIAGVMTVAHHDKLDGIEDSATADQSNAEILTAIENGVDSVHYVDGSIDTVHIGDNQVTEAKLADSLLAEIDANTAKATNVAGDLTATANASSLTIETSNGDNVSLPDAIGYTAPNNQGPGRWGVMTDEQAYKVESNNNAITTFALLIGNIPTNNQKLWINQVGDIDVGSEASDENDHLMTALAIKNRIEDYTTGTVDTANSPVANDFARFTDADTIEGRSYTEVKNDLTLSNVEDKSSADIRSEIVSADIPNNAANTTGTAEQANLASLSDESTDQTCFITFASDATGYERLKTGSNLTFDSSTGTLTANYIIGKTNTFTFTQSSVSSTWIITHNLDKFPNVTVVDSGGSVVRGLITYNTVNKLTITFFAGGTALAFSGKAYLN